MASEMLGRAQCPECGFPHAHVKIKTDKENALPYRHCPDCGSQYFTKNKMQGAALIAKMASAAPEKTAAPSPAPDPAPTPTTEPAKKTKLVFGVEVPA